MDERKLIEGLKLGCEESFTKLYHAYWGKVYNFSRLYLNSASDSEEVVQEVFVKLWNIRMTLDVEQNFKGLLFIITRNIIFNHSRRTSNESFYKLSVLTAFEESYAIEDELETEDMKKYIDQLIENMPPKQRKIFNLSRKEYLSYKEIAERLNISERTVERHIKESLKYLRSNIRLYNLFLSL